MTRDQMFMQLEAGTKIVVEVTVAQCEPRDGGRGWVSDACGNICIDAFDGQLQPVKVWIKADQVKQISIARLEDVDHGS